MSRTYISNQYLYISHWQRDSHHCSLLAPPTDRERWWLGVTADSGCITHHPFCPPPCNHSPSVPSVKVGERHMDPAFHLHAMPIHLHLRPSPFLCSGEWKTQTSLLVAWPWWPFEPQPAQNTLSSALHPRTTATQPLIGTSNPSSRKWFLFLKKTESLPCLRWDGRQPFAPPPLLSGMFAQSSAYMAKERAVFISMRLTKIWKW